jgi:twitching motility protein PilT
MLIPRSDGPGRVLAIEVMVPNAAIRNLIREDKLHQIYSQMQVGQAGHGMQTMNQSLAALARKNQISRDDALAYASDPDEMRMLLEGKPVPPGGLRR